MPTPVYRFRLAADDQKNLIEVSKLYGAPNTSVFLREMVGALCSGDSKRITDFSERLMAKMGEQLALDFANKAASTAQKPALPAKPARKGAKRGRSTKRP